MERQDKDKDKDEGKDKRAKAAWPSVERQLADSKVVPGSALEKLIRDNQDFHMLRPEELNDGQPIPLWLRVHWRKMHPELDYSGPKVGYPLILKEVLSWMIRHQDLPATPAPANDSLKPGGKDTGKN